MRENIIPIINKEYFKKLKNLSINHKKLVVCFSGFSGSGKTHIAKILEKKYKGVRIRNDDIRKIIIKKKIREIDKITYSYLEWLLKNWKFKNKLIILDSGIDRRYLKILALLKKKKYPVFIIRINTSKRIACQRAFERANGEDKHFKNNIDRWIKEWEDFGKEVKADIILSNKENLDLNPLFKILNEKIK